MAWNRAHCRETSLWNKLESFFAGKQYWSMEQHTLKNVSNYLNTNIYSYLETSGGQSSIIYLNAVHFFNTSVNSTSVAA